MYILIAILLFGFLIVTHELGHFLTAKMFHVKVEEFSVGMGPTLFKKRGKETLYALRLFPIGGFCAMNEDDGESEDHRAFVNQKWWKRIIILSAGTVMNFLTGFIILLCIVPRSQSYVSPTVSEFFDGCPYQSEDQLLVGDTFYKIDGHRVFFSSNVGMLLSRGNDDLHDIKIIRDGEKIVYEDFKLSTVEYTVDSEKVEKYGLIFAVEEQTFWGGIRNTWYCTIDFVRMVWLGLSDIISGAVGLRDLSGPVGIVQIINEVGVASETTSAALFSIAYLCAFIAINLAVMNMLPIPALDGGRVLFLIVTVVIEKISKKKLDPKYEAYIHTAGLFLLLGLMAVVMFSDILRLFS